MAESVSFRGCSVPSIKEGRYKTHKLVFFAAMRRDGQEGSVQATICNAKQNGPMNTGFPIIKDLVTLDHVFDILREEFSTKLKHSKIKTFLSASTACPIRSLKSSRQTGKRSNQRENTSAKNVSVASSSTACL
jgi:hypothetical protein